MINNEETRSKLAKEVVETMTLEDLTSFVMQRLEQDYAGLYETGGEGDFSAISNFGSKWGWYQSIYALAKGDVTKYEDITELNVHQCLYALEFIKEKNELEQKQIKKSFK